MIGVLAAAMEPGRFARLVLVGPSPRYVERRRLRRRVPPRRTSTDCSTSSTATTSAGPPRWRPSIMGNPDRPELAEELTNSFCRTDPDIAKQFARVTFLSDNRADLSRVASALAHPAVRRGRHRADGGRASTSTATWRTAGWCSAGDGTLPEPERAGGDDRRDQGVPGSDVAAAESIPAHPESARSCTSRPRAATSSPARRHDRARQPDPPPLDRLRGPMPCCRASAFRIS